jgi:hypothetical protein
VFCVDDMSQIQALGRSQPVLPMMPGVPQRLTHDYVRSGTITLFVALGVATGKVIGLLHRRHRAEKFKTFLIRLDQESRRTWTCTWRWTTTPLTRPGDHDLAGRPLPLPPALHPHRIVLTQPGGTLVYRADEQADTTRSSQARPGIGEGHPRLASHLNRIPDSGD